ncbi:MAG: metallophosphoesterase family protein [Acidobacteriaceae bacterium]|nr:metallophosphoesterase family protein [Acidobacteriaceae bacterium]
MQFLIVADLHANWYALEAVLADCAGEFDQIICCGDLVGYNPHPARVIEWTRASCSVVIRGNHDKVVAGLENLEWFNDVAQAAARWTIRQLSDDQLTYLRLLNPGPVKLEHFHICHGSPRNEDEYVTTVREAAPCFADLDLPIAFFGHTHLQGGFFSQHGRVGKIPAVRENDSSAVLELKPNVLYMVNPGSVGQPRDGDPRAAYAFYDSDRRLVTLRRADYAIQKTAEEIIKADLPDVLAFRLFQGL